MCNEFLRNEAKTYHWSGVPDRNLAEIERLHKENKRQEELLKISYTREAEVNQLRDFLCKSDPSLDLSNGTINTAIKEIGNAKASILILQTELAILKNSQKA